MTAVSHLLYSMVVIKNLVRPVFFFKFIFLRFHLVYIFKYIFFSFVKFRESRGKNLICVLFCFFFSEWFRSGAAVRNRVLGRDVLAALFILLARQRSPFGGSFLEWKAKMRNSFLISVGINLSSRGETLVALNETLIKLMVALCDWLLHSGRRRSLDCGHAVT